MALRDVWGWLTKKSYDQLEKDYNEAVAAGKEVFQVQGQDVLVSYIKYVLEYYAPKFKNVK